MMKPIKLELMGLNSYTDKQTIDFEKLTSRGLFGIFGNTGSGKSNTLAKLYTTLFSKNESPGDKPSFSLDDSKFIFIDFK